MDFKEDVNALRPPSNVKFNLVGAKLPNSQDIYFRAKQKELIDQYMGTRLYLSETDNSDWSHWYQKPDDETVDGAFHNIFKGYFYEAALFLYNVVVDLSWTLTYVSAEFACTKKGQRVDISGMKPIEEAVGNSVTNPTAEDKRLYVS